MRIDASRLLSSSLCAFASLREIMPFLSPRILSVPLCPLA